MSHCFSVITNPCICLSLPHSHRHLYQHWISRRFQLKSVSTQPKIRRFYDQIRVKDTKLSIQSQNRWGRCTVATKRRTTDRWARTFEPRIRECQWVNDTWLVFWGGNILKCFWTSHSSTVVRVLFLFFSVKSTLNIVRTSNLPLNTA